MTIIVLMDGKIKTEKLSTAEILSIVLTPVKAAAGNKYGQWAGAKGE